MATIWADGFDDIAVANLSADYSGNNHSGMSITTGRRSGSSALTFPNTTTFYSINRALNTSVSTLFFSCALKFTAFNDYNSSQPNTMIRLLEGSTQHLSMNVNSSGQIWFHRGPESISGSLIGTSTIAPFALNTWNWIQVKIVIHDTTGSIEVRDGSGGNIVTFSNVDTRNGGTGVISTFQFGRINGQTGTAAIDDLHIWDTTGTVCNTWTNDTRVDSKLPTGAGDLAQFTPSAGANYECVDDAALNTTDYVTSATAGHQDLYQFGDLSHNPPTIYSVMRSAVAQKDDAGSRSLKMLTKSGGVLSAGSNKTLTAGTYLRAFDISETDPATSAAWTQAGFNAAQFGFENV